MLPAITPARWPLPSLAAAAAAAVQVLVSRGLLGFGVRKMRQWPPELMPLAYALYHFQVDGWVGGVEVGGWCGGLQVCAVPLQLCAYVSYVLPLSPSTHTRTPLLLFALSIFPPTPAPTRRPTRCQNIE